MDANLLISWLARNDVMLDHLERNLFSYVLLEVQKNVLVVCLWPVCDS